MKKLTLFEENGVEHKQFNKSFDLLDADRIYKKDKLGECNIINMDIESIGVIEPLQGLIDSCFVLKLKIEDILAHSFINYKLMNTYKIEFNSTNSANEMKIRLYNENHTLGNLINEYFKITSKKGIEGVSDVIVYNNYKLVHPLEEIIEFNVKVNEDNEDFKNILIKNTIYEEDNQNKVTFIFVKVLENIVNDITILINKLIIAQQKAKLKKIQDKPSFEIVKEEIELNKY